MSVMATLVVGSDGSATMHGKSKSVSSGADREIFLKRRREMDCIIIGGNTARNEPYLRTPVPLVILSRGEINPLSENPLARLWNSSPTKAVARARKEFGENILIEGGPALINEFMALGLIDELELSITQISGGENKIDVEKLLGDFSKKERLEIDGTIFWSCKR